ncbi:tetratricopeptide repeat protein 9C isoform X2 [Paramormyrops kingsleyae]|uniref:tetratricopeptide repeat protein 9C isoform X2 n=1 Tax=Paramormyrops kingsleyae TaxID=1676925 RepID=UPI000CD5E218|nr:tetratricopeptide repeat protein 9C isoform X2 [Paramormyrops kingsleyae]
MLPGETHPRRHWPLPPRPAGAAKPGLCRDGHAEGFQPADASPNPPAGGAAEKHTACLLQRECVDYARVQEYSLRVLQWRPGDVKALYRAGIATLELGDAHTARQYLTEASRGQPSDANVKRHLQRAEERLSSEYQREKALYKGMFGKQKEDTGEGGSGVTLK